MTAEVELWFENRDDNNVYEGLIRLLGENDAGEHTDAVGLFNL